MKLKWVGMALLLALNGQAIADDAEAAARIEALEKQLKVLSEELMAVQQQMAQTKDTKIEEKGKSKGNPVYASFKDGVTLEDGSGNWQIALNGRIQADYRDFHPDASAADTFSLRRARIGGTATFYKNFSARVEGEYSGGSTTLTYGYFDINKFKQAKLRIGQFKPFYGLERAMSTNFLDFQERSMADSLLGSTYDRGIMVHGSPIAGTYYSLAYINGAGTTDEPNAKNDNKDLTVRATGNLAELADLQNMVVHFGGWYGRGQEGSRRIANFIPTGQTEGRGAQFFSTSCSGTVTGACPTATTTGLPTANAFKDNVDRDRYGLESALAYGSVKLQGEYIESSFDGPGYSRNIDSWYAGAMWNVTGEAFADMYKDGVFGRLKPKSNFGDSGWGAFQIGMRYSKFDASDFTTTNAAGTGVLLVNSGLTGSNNVAAVIASLPDGLVTATNEADAWTVGVNWIINPNARLIFDYVHTKFYTPITVRVNGANATLNSEDALTMRAQYDF
ncbi:MAG: OprO/OprP family phosphate-selective porin [Methylophilaceae bacterium]